HGPTFSLDLRWGQLSVRPLSDKVGQYLGHDRLARRVGESFSHQLHGPLGNPTLGFPVADYLSQRERRDNGDGMGLEVVAQLAPSQDHHITASGSVDSVS